MKKILHYIMILAASISVSTFSACKQMDSTYKEYIVPGGTTYTGKITSPVVYSGRNRVKISWLKGSDPNVINAKVFWNNYADSISVSIPPTGDTISVVIGNLEEQTYSFIVKTYDNKGNSSIPVELLGSSYGNKYQSNLLNRPVIASDLDLSGKLNIQWGSANITGGFYATDVTYTDNTGTSKVKRFGVSELVSGIFDYKQGTSYKYRTVYVPNSISIDTFYTAYSVQQVAEKLSKLNWTATADSYALTSQLPNGGPMKAIDDNITTFWHTETSASKVYPHWLAVDMKKMFNVTRVELTCRQAVATTFTSFTIQGSLDGVNWTSYDTFTLIQKDATQSFLITGSPQMSYVRIYAAAGPNYYAHLAEFSAFGY